MYRILLVEDDYALSEEIKKQLVSNGYEAASVADFRGVIDEFTAYAPHLVLMDIMLPFRDGYYWTACIRKVSNVPIVFISSASDSMNIVMAVNMGGDDFISKPVSAPVLIAKVQAILRRTYELSDVPYVMSFCGAELNVDDCTVSKDGKKTELTKNEFRILKTLLENRGKIVSRDSLMLVLWNDDCFVEENTLSVNVNRVRKKLADLGIGDLIKTKSGQGYTIP